MDSCVCILRNLILVSFSISKFYRLNGRGLAYVRGIGSHPVAVFSDSYRDRSSNENAGIRNGHLATAVRSCHVMPLESTLLNLPVCR